PNVLIIVADDLGWDDVSFHGSKQIYTPNIDALASDGITFTNYYVSPLCTPSRSALLTGKHPIHIGTQHFVIAAASPWGTSLDVKMFPQYLKELGYKTHLVGKWHQGHHKKEFLPTYRGFDSHFGYRHGKGDYYDHSDLERYWGYDIWRDLKPVYKEYNNSYSTTIYKDEVKTLIKSYQNSSHPFFIMFSPMAVHAGGSYSSFQAPKEYVDRFPHIKDLHRRMFAGMLAALDDAIGEIFEELSKSEAIDNTIILFTSDNGGVPSGFSQETSAGSNWPLRGAKYTLWEGGVKGISFLWSKLLKKSGYIYENLIHIQDWLPTLYSAIGGSKSSLPSDLDGKDFWEALSNAKLEPVRSEILHNIDDKLGVYALRYKNYKIVYGTNYNGELDGWFKPAGSESEKNKFEYSGVVSEILK
ncbi:arylsulfatase B-like protein, partial [Dinothrombium tinctorium]